MHASGDMSMALSLGWDPSTKSFSGTVIELRYAFHVSLPSSSVVIQLERLPISLHTDIYVSMPSECERMPRQMKRHGSMPAGSGFSLASMLSICGAHKAS